MYSKELFVQTEARRRVGLFSATKALYGYRGSVVVYTWLQVLIEWISRQKTTVLT